jgi:hypothetical protein
MGSTDSRLAGGGGGSLDGRALGDPPLDGGDGMGRALASAAAPVLVLLALALARAGSGGGLPGPVAEEGEGEGEGAGAAARDAASAGSDGGRTPAPAAAAVAFAAAIASGVTAGIRVESMRTAAISVEPSVESEYRPGDAGLLLWGSSPSGFSPGEREPDVELIRVASSGPPALGYPRAILGLRVEA